jgi:predicted O-methyltransferase YrrM
LRLQKLLAFLTKAILSGMTQKLWTAVDRYLADRLIPPDPVLEDVLRANAAAGLPAQDVAPNQGKLLYLLALISGGKKFLEIGTLGGYSTIWLARALPPGGKLVTLERSEKHAAIATANIARAGLGHAIEIRVGEALESLSRLHAEGAGPFDFIFIDADKVNNPGYLEWSLRLSGPGTAIVGDNVVRGGTVADPNDPTPHVRGVRRFFEMLASEPTIEATAVQTVGSKGHDGFALAVVRHAALER